MFGLISTQKETNFYINMLGSQTSAEKQQNNSKGNKSENGNQLNSVDALVVHLSDLEIYQNPTIHETCSRDMYA